MPGEGALNLKQLLEQVPELRELLVDLRRSALGEAAAIEKLMGIARRHIVCPGCGRVIDPRHPNKE